MKTLLTRSLSGVVFAVGMLLSIWFSRWSFTILFFIINIGCLWEYYTITQPLLAPGRTSAKTYRWIGVILGALVFIFFAARAGWWLPANADFLFVIPLFVFAAIELLSLSPQAIRNAALNVFGLLYISVSFGMLLLITQRVDLYETQQQWFPSLVAPALGLLLLIWANDTFAYLGGTLVGKNKLYPEISPGKTWEGVLVGALSALLAAYGLYRWLGIYEKHVWMGLALIASIVGTVGDLFESMIKRNVGIKDSGKIMPGHGGFLDRFDAFIFCIPFAWAWLHLST
jgi:phosphatidate cytidylyltransferase